MDLRFEYIIPREFGFFNFGEPNQNKKKGGGGVKSRCWNVRCRGLPEFVVDDFVEIAGIQALVTIAVSFGAVVGVLERNALGSAVAAVREPPLAAVAFEVSRRVMLSAVNLCRCRPGVPLVAAIAWQRLDKIVGDHIQVVLAVVAGALAVFVCVVCLQRRRPAAKVAQYVEHVVDRVAVVDVQAVGVHRGADMAVRIPAAEDAVNVTPGKQAVTIHGPVRDGPAADLCSAMAAIVVPHLLDEIGDHPDAVQGGVVDC